MFLNLNYNVLSCFGCVCLPHMYNVYHISIGFVGLIEVELDVVGWVVQ